MAVTGCAIVTGAGSATGIGFAVARVLGASGLPVVLTSTTERIHDRVSDLTAAGMRATGVVADLTDSPAARSVVEHAVATFGSVAVLVNNAGMVSVGSTSVTGDLTTLDDAQWRAGMERNLSTAVRMCRAAIPLMRAESYGRIVNVTSVTGPVMAMRGEVVYAAAKAGMVGLTRAVAVDEAAHGITCNAVAPGWIATGSQTPHEEIQGSRVPVGRSGTPEEVAHVVAMLCRPEAGYITGQVLTVDGGNSIAEER